MRSASLRLSVPVAASADAVWAAAADWSRQGEWMLGTTVHLIGGDGGSGSRLAAFTGVADVGFLDTMEVVEFRPPESCRVRHTGALISGDGGFRVVRCGPEVSTFIWWEELTLPAGGSLVWPVVRPAFAWGLRRSLSRFAAFARQYADGEVR